MLPSHHNVQGIPSKSIMSANPADYRKDLWGIFQDQSRYLGNVAQSVEAQANMSSDIVYRLMASLAL